MRQLPLALLFALTLTALPARGASLDEKTPDQQSIDALEAKALAAQPREQYYLYAQLMHEMTEFSIVQYAAGDGDKATALLKRIQLFAGKIHASVGEDNKKMKDSEILLRHTAFRLSGILHNSTSEDRPLVEKTLALVNQAQAEALLQVFRK
jgi:hypothetical protein